MDKHQNTHTSILGHTDGQTYGVGNTDTLKFGNKEKHTNKLTWSNMQHTNTYDTYYIR